MQGHPSARELVDGGELPRQQGRRGEAGPLRDQDVEPVGDAKHMLSDLQAIGRGGVKRQQHPVETGILVGLGYGLNMVTIQHRAGTHDGLRRIVVADISDEFH